MVKYWVKNYMRFGNAEAADRGLSYATPIAQVVDGVPQVVSGQDPVNSC